MNATSGEPTPRSNIERAIDRVSEAESFSKKIRDALEHTAKGFATQDEKEAHWFLTTEKLNEILNRKTLGPLFEELLTKFGDESRFISPHLRLDIDSGTTSLTEICIEATVGDLSRRVMLALFLYLHQDYLFRKFIQWTTSSNLKTPSDDSMPFKREALTSYGIRDIFHGQIIRSQAMFRPVTIRKGQDTDLRYTQRLPFIGTHTHIEEGSSGTVFNVEIAPGYWYTENVNGSFKPDDTHSSTGVAIKTFRESNIRNMEETTIDFRTELKILRKIRESNLRHNRILLDWGSITEFDEAGRTIQHSLIFQLAKFNLAQFFQHHQRFRTYTRKSILIEKLVDIVEALEFLHGKLSVIHLDIKPENILVYEKGSSRPDNDNLDQSKLALKLTDFGLSRERGGKQRTGDKRIEVNNGISQSSATPAPRSAGTYQGPEIQARGSSFAGRRSDIWSIGCVALMMMAFIINGPDEVTKLQHKLSVDFMPRNGHETLFYIRSDTFAWNKENYRYHYLEGFEPDIDEILWKEPRLQAAVHPQVIAWSNVIHTNYRGFLGEPLIKQYFKDIFCLALRISPAKRATADVLLKRLRIVQSNWKSLESSGASIDQLSATSRPHSLYDGRHDMQPERPQAPPHNGEGSVARLPPSVSSPDPQASEKAIFFSAIKKDNAADVRRELDKTPQLLKSQSPESGAYPIQHAIIHERYEALKVLLNKADCDAMQQKSHGRNVLQQACAEPGDAKALRCLCEKARLIEFTKETYKKYRGKLQRDARKAFEELYQKANA
jgi:serine/threonine protein kinase